MATIRSFDVFDTCLCRAACEPSDVFRRIAENLAGRLPAALPAAEWIEDFVAARSEAERRARANTEAEEITLEALWVRLVAMLPPGSVYVGAGMALELEAERNALGPIASTQAAVARYRAEGCRIVFVSDTYLPASFVREILRHHGFLAGDDGLYVSSDVGRTKLTGNLFRHVIASEKCASAQLHHTGDNPISDVQVPRTIGIRAELFRSSTPDRLETALAAQDPVSRRAWRRTAATIRFHRLTRVGGAPGPAENLVRNFLGPLLCVHAWWLLTSAHCDGIRHLYFAARDARLSYQVARSLAGDHFPDIACSYLQVSRRALLPASITELTAEGLPWLLRRYEAPTLPILLEKIGLPLEQFASHWRQRRPAWHFATPLARADLGLFWELLQSDPIATQVLAHARIRRANALRYFERMGLLDSTPAALVDLGWYLTCQRALNEICAPARKGPPLAGYYLGLKQDRLSGREAGPATALFREHAPDQPAAKHLDWLRTRINLLEHIVGMADHGTVEEYSAAGEPRHASVVAAAENEKAFRDIANALDKYLAAHGGDWRELGENSGEAKPFLAHLIDSFFRAPDRDALHSITHLTWTSSQNAAATAPLVQPYRWSEILALAAPERLQRHLFAPAKREWPEAALVASRPALRACVRNLPLVHRVYATLKLG